ncbi:MAG TPA: helix-turn-helix domain-containing protein [Longimicrobiales bacterium]|nr:helix-turn-helix domain-containing protein [Longimicrobiales bacterium]
MGRSVNARERFLGAALRLIREKGYEATTVDELCRAAGLTKGSFFHHFEDKEALGLAAAAAFASMAESIFRAAPYRSRPDPLDRVLGYIDFRAAIMAGEIPDWTCLLGTMVQECYETHPRLREACERHIREHADTVARDIAAAKELYAPDADWTPESLAMHVQAVIQGAFVLGKAQYSPAVAVGCVRHLRRYVELLFPGRRPEAGEPAT